MADIKKDTFVYEYGGGIYINPTNRCTNNCRFCLRNLTDGIAGTELWLSREPSAEEIIEDLKPLLPLKKITFCGFGEPMLALDMMKAVSEFAKNNGIYVKVNTNGQANLYYRRDVLPDLKGLVNGFSISLNASNAEKYQTECQSIYGMSAYASILYFAKEAVALGFDTTLSVVDYLPEEEIEACRKISDEVGAVFCVRHMA